MTDYLEDLLEQEGVLLEQVRRMERSLAGPVFAERTGEAAPAPAKQRDESLALEGRGVLRAVEQASSQTRSAGAWVGPAAGTAEWGVLPGWEEASALEEKPGRSEEVLSPREGTALLEEMERLDRAAVLSDSRSGGSTARSGRNGGGGTDAPSAAVRTFPALGGAPATDWPEGRSLGESAGPAGELSWAEEADRVFRRDSRRYDGGFYLY